MTSEGPATHCVMARFAPGEVGPFAGFADVFTSLCASAVQSVLRRNVHIV
jgi:hypothetical protein